ncbi:hypothetical protein GCM10010507_20660 [Streptomyces cinnamoneus]|uniref:Uncharacterized protein n=1 Tax=Streptomyces cinnamoneus TaxID=53446 RepID=A0A918TET5_STRCJ|nr:hypothetical protein GCM10010507_20660 [Streptomyces cinnamoneus]
MATVGDIAAVAGLFSYVIVVPLFVPHATSCSEVMRFAGGRMPQQATGRKCINEGARLDCTYSAEFTMPREDVVARLKEAGPHPVSAALAPPGHRRGTSSLRDA